MLPRFKIQYPMKNQCKNRQWLIFSILSYPRPLILYAFDRPGPQCSNKYELEHGLDGFL